MGFIIVFNDTFTLNNILRNLFDIFLDIIETINYHVRVSIDLE